MEIIKTILMLASLGFGLFIFAVAVYGMFKLDYVLNRVHVAAMTDTLATFCILLALIIFSGWNVTSLKIGLVLVFMWLSGPVAVHLIGQTEVITNDDIEKEAEVIEQ